MTSEKILNCYKWLSALTAIVSIIGPVFLVEGSMKERFWIGVLVNLQFHMVFQFLSRVPPGIYHHVEKDKPQNRVMANRVLRVFSMVVMALSVFGFIQFLRSAIDNHEQLLATMTFPGMFLGGYSSSIKLKEQVTMPH